MAAVQAELGETAVSAVVSVASDDGDAEIQFEARISRHLSVCAAMPLGHTTCSLQQLWQALHSAAGHRKQRRCWIRGYRV